MNLARKPPALWSVETGRTLYGLAWAQAVNGSVVHRTFLALTKRGARRRADRWLRRLRSGS